MSQQLKRARVSFAAHEVYRLLLEDVELAAEPSGKLRGFGELPAVGDWVMARLAGDFALIEEVLPRFTAFIRRAAGRRVEAHCVAANMDVVFIVCGLDGDFNPRRVERYFVLAKESGAEPVIVLNKSDVCADTRARAALVEAIAPGASVLPLCARESVEPLRPLLEGRTAALLGSSGAGKTTIANALAGGERWRTQSVRESDSRGRHTTTSRMLIPLPDGAFLIDTPGMRELALWADESTLDSVFTDVAELAGRCRFADCTHETEPGCEVRAALEAGALDFRRWESFRKLRGEIRRQEIESNVHLRLEQRRRWKMMHKAMRNWGKGD